MGLHRYEESSGLLEARGDLVALDIAILSLRRVRGGVRFIRYPPFPPLETVDPSS